MPTINMPPPTAVAPLPLDALRPENDGERLEWPETFLLTNTHRWVLEEVVHWKRSHGVSPSELAEYAKREEAQGLLVFIGLGDLEDVEIARGYPYRPAT